MAWQDNAILVLRNMIGDTLTSTEYDDTRLEELIISSAYFVIGEVSFNSTYIVDISDLSITPDPTTDTAFLSLVILKAAWMIASSEHRVASKKAISMRDGPSAIDSRGIADHKRLLAEAAKKAYSDAKFNYQFGDGTVGAAIVTPYGELFDNTHIR